LAQRSIHEYTKSASFTTLYYQFCKDKNDEAIITIHKLLPTAPFLEPVRSDPEPVTIVEADLEETVDEGKSKDPDEEEPVSAVGEFKESGIEVPYCALQLSKQLLFPTEQEAKPNSEAC
jgi:hypothetical protein